MAIGMQSAHVFYVSTFGRVGTLHDPPQSSRSVVGLPPSSRFELMRAVGQLCRNELRLSRRLVIDGAKDGAGLGDDELAIPDVNDYAIGKRSQKRHSY